MSEHWSEDYEHDSLVAPEARASFVKSMSKYDTVESAMMGGHEAMKVAGRPYKLPKSIDGIPDEKDRADFIAGVSKLTGVIDKEESIPADFNFSDGLEDGAKLDDELVKMFKKHSVDTKKTTAQMTADIKLWNSLMRGRRETQAAETTAEMKASNEALLKSYDNDPKALEVDIENMRRTFQNHAGLTAEEFEQIADDLMGPDKDGKAGAILRSPVLARALLKLLAPMSKEGTGEQGKGGTPLKAGATPKEQLPKTAEALGW